MTARKIAYFLRAWFHIWLVTKYAILFTEPSIIFIDLLLFFFLGKIVFIDKIDSLYFPKSDYQKQCLFDFSKMWPVQKL